MVRTVKNIVPAVRNIVQIVMEVIRKERTKTNEHRANALTTFCERLRYHKLAYGDKIFRNFWL